MIFPSWRIDPVFVNLLGSPGIDSPPCGPVRQPYLSNLTARIHTVHRLAVSGLLKRLQIRALVGAPAIFVPYVRPPPHYPPPVKPPPLPPRTGINLSGQWVRSALQVSRLLAETQFFRQLFSLCYVSVGAVGNTVNHETSPFGFSYNKHCGFRWDFPFLLIFTAKSNSIAMLKI